MSRRSDDDPWDWEEVVPVIAEGSITANEAEIALTDNEQQRERRLRRERLARRRPPGFAPWPS